MRRSGPSPSKPAFTTPPVSCLVLGCVCQSLDRSRRWTINQTRGTFWIRHMRTGNADGMYSHFLWPPLWKQISHHYPRRMLVIFSRDDFKTDIGGIIRILLIYLGHINKEHSRSAATSETTAISSFCSSIPFATSLNFIGKIIKNIRYHMASPCRVCLFLPCASASIHDQRSVTRNLFLRFTYRKKKRGCGCGCERTKPVDHTAPTRRHAQITSFR